jgi:hypothetical protein
MKNPVKAFFGFLTLGVLIGASLTSCMINEDTIHQYRPKATSTVEIQASSTPTEVISVSTEVPTVVMSPTIPTVTSSQNDYMAGVSVLAFGNEPDFNEKSHALLSRLSSHGVTHVSFTFHIRVDGIQATYVFSDESITVSDENIRTFIQNAHLYNMHVTIRPIIDEGNLKPQWRGEINPPDIIGFFQSYEHLMMHYANLAQSENADAINIGSELNSLEQYSDNWSLLIRNIRSVFTGQITYSSNHDMATQLYAFKHELDFYSIDAYYSLGVSAEASVEELVNAWSTIIQGLSNSMDMSKVVISEIGIIPYHDVYNRPFMWGEAAESEGLERDTESQRKFYEATCKALVPVTAGLYWWYFGMSAPDVNYFSTHDPSGKPAEMEVSNCFNNLP